MKEEKATWLRLQAVIYIMASTIFLDSKWNLSFWTQVVQTLVSIIYSEAAGHINSHPPPIETISEFGFFTPLSFLG